MEGGDVEVNVRMKEILGNRYTKKKTSYCKLSFLCDRGLCGVCLPIFSFQNLKNSMDVIIRVFFKFSTAINTSSIPAPHNKTGILI